ncbi:MAG: hypothetical protein ACK5LX_04680 [Oscillospiraceae bacterium]
MLQQCKYALRLNLNQRLFALGGTLLLMLAVYFGCALAKSLFFRSRIRGFLGALSVVAVMYLSNILNLVLGLFLPTSRFGPFISLSVTVGFNAGTIAYILLLLVEIAVLFFTTSRLIERKINL